MEAKDTVLKDTIISLPTYGNRLDIRSELEVQAEVSFKAGYKQRKDEENPLFEQGKQAGIREVVEWIRDEYGQDVTEPYIYIIEHTYKRWQDKLKEWDISS